MSAATSSSDRYDEAQKAIDALALQISHERGGPSDASGHTLRVLIDAHTALCALTAPPAVAETPEKAAMRVYMGIHSFPWLVHGDAMRDLITRGYLAGIQAAWESWEPENAPGHRGTMTRAQIEDAWDRAEVQTHIDYDFLRDFVTNLGIEAV